MVLALGTCQLAAAGVGADRARHGHLGRSAGNRLSASRSGALGCELAVRDGSHPGDVFVLSDGESPSSSRLHAFAVPFDVLSPLPAPLGSAGTLATLPRASAPAAPFVPALSGRGPPHR